MAKYLTAVAVERLKPGASRREIADGGVQGLYLVVQPSGAKSWAVRYRVSNRPRKLTLGPYPRIDLVRAREQARKAFDRLHEGRDPAAEKRVAKQFGGDDVGTFGGALRTYIQRHTRQHNKSWIESARLLGLKPDPRDPQGLAAVKGGLVERWGHRGLGEIRRRDVIALLDEIVDRNAGIVSNRTLAALGPFFNWALSREMIETSPCAGVKKPAKERSRDRVLTAEEIRLLWRAADALGHPYGYIAQLLLLSGQRLGEVSGMTRAELDLDKRVWSLPPERTKNGRPHEVPTSDAALAILAKVPKLHGTELLFTRDGRKPVSGFWHAKVTLDAGMAGVPPWTFHDLRRTAASGMADIGIVPHVVEACLNHVSGAKRGVAGIYNRSTYATEKRAAMERWARELERIVGGQTATVVAFPRPSP